VFQGRARYDAYTGDPSHRMRSSPRVSCPGHKGSDVDSRDLRAARRLGTDPPVPSLKGQWISQCRRSEEVECEYILSRGMRR
jgi:hypothetical protein